VKGRLSQFDRWEMGEQGKVRPLEKARHSGGDSREVKSGSKKGQDTDVSTTTREVPKRSKKSKRDTSEGGIRRGRFGHPTAKGEGLFRGRVVLINQWGKEIRV